MIKTLIVSGCSYTAYPNQWEDRPLPPKNPGQWPDFVRDILGIDVVNLAQPAAGNRYIAASIIDYLSEHNPDPKTTMVIVMWSGASRKDLLVDAEFWYNTAYKYKTKFENRNDCYWIFSGGKNGTWLHPPKNWMYNVEEIKHAFENLYLVSSDPLTLCKETLYNINTLSNYLTERGYHYRFSSIENCWNTTLESSSAFGDYYPGHFARELPLYKTVDWDKWIFVNSNRDCLYEYTRDCNGFESDGVHPNADVHAKFAREFIIPIIQGIK